MITLDKRFVDAFKNGSKRVEVRTRIPKLLFVGDDILVAQKGTNGRIVLRLIVDKVMYYTPLHFWERYGAKTALTEEEFKAYVKTRNHVYGLYCREVYSAGSTVTCRDYGVSLAPQWFAPVYKGSDLNKLVLWRWC